MGTVHLVMLPTRSLTSLHSAVFPITSPSEVTVYTTVKSVRRVYYNNRKTCLLRSVQSKIGPGYLHENWAVVLKFRI